MTHFTEYYGCGIKDDRIDLSEHQNVIAQIHSHYQSLLSEKQLFIENSENQNVTNSNESLQTGDLKILVEVTGYKYDTVQKIVRGLRNNKKVIKVFKALPIAKAQMIETLKAVFN